MNRNLVLLLASGHTVKIALRPDDLTDPTLNNVTGFLETVPAVGVYDDGAITFAFVEDMISATLDDEPNDFQRIDAYSPGETL